MKSLANLLVVLLLATSNRAIPALSVASGVNHEPPAAQASRKNTRVANDFPGADLGAKINAADKALANSPGEILVREPGCQKENARQAGFHPGWICR